jgi:coenzyme PQQ precursor peptide PqqA
MRTNVQSAEYAAPHKGLWQRGKAKVLFSTGPPPCILTLVLPVSDRLRPNHHHEGNIPMAWKTPKLVEIALGAEINSYACAESKK